MKSERLKEAKTWAGYRKAVWVDECNTMVVLVDCAEQGIDSDSRWALICDNHGSILVFDLQSAAKNFMSEVGDWCSGCSEDAAAQSQSLYERNRYCPKCKSDQRGDLIPAEIRHLYSGDHWYRMLSIYSRKQDRTVAFQCADCGHEWERK